jgi:hypothetical protein
VSAERICEQCGRTFKPVRPNARFHNDRCRAAWHKAHPLAGDPVAVFMGQVAAIRRRRPSRRLPHKRA